ncbi:hypothetical protein [Streptomyces katrae]|uniref:hypothetical protein n=1 Tax=Streptomyces katrae TaxID=68223 RepID=UPI00131DDC3D|nr:hypothetical protein [Streptomyces katrae]
MGIVGRADDLRLPALGASASLASQILFDGGGQANTWRSEQPAFAAACDAVAAATVKRAERRPSRFPPERRRQFLEYLRAGMATTKAAAEVGITSATVYQRRSREPDFAEAMDRATATRSTPEPASAASDVQWTAFYDFLDTHGVPPARACLDKAFTEHVDWAKGALARGDEKAVAIASKVLETLEKAERSSSRNVGTLWPAQPSRRRHLCVWREGRRGHAW